MLDWKDTINPLASGIKCVNKVTTVSPTYLEELRYMSNGLEDLFEYEKGKCTGILNGIDTRVWDPKTDTYLDDHYSVKDVENGKLANKKILVGRRVVLLIMLNLDFKSLPFIGNEAYFKNQFFNHH